MRLLFLILCFGIFGGVVLAQPHYFTVQDSIEMARFARQDPNVQFSPDQKYFAIVTSRGIIRSNTIESAIWIFETAAVRSYVKGQTLSAPAPKMIARWAATPKMDYSTSYEPVISNLQWLPDSQAILFLAQNSYGECQIYSADLTSHSIRALTQPGRNIVQFIYLRGAVVYEATPAGQTSPTGISINADVRDITDIPLWQILTPKEFSYYYAYNNLWIMRNGKTIMITRADILKPLPLLNYYFPHIFGASPNGDKLVVLAPVENVSKSWREYEPVSPEFASRRFNSEDPFTTSIFNFLRPTEYMLINVQNGEAIPLIDAPNALALAYDESNGAVWSNDGKRVLVMNTFLPLNGVSPKERARRIRSCDAATIDIDTKRTSCVGFNRANVKLIKGSFGQTAADVILDFVNISTKQRREEHYRYKDGDWRLVHPSAVAATRDTFPVLAVSVVVKQDLNTPPALWATDVQTKKIRKLWDPNPQLAKINLGTVSVFTWKDSIGHIWRAGLVKPPNYISGKRYPLVIQTHGFFPDEFMTDGSYTTAFAARPLASAGIIVLQMGAYDSHSLQREAFDQIRGYVSAIDRLAADGLIDPNKIGIIGFSRTCWHAESALIKNPKLFAAASITDGIDMSYMQYLEGEVGERDREEEQVYGVPPFRKGLAAWIKGAPGFHLDRVQAPLMITGLGPASVLSEWEIYASLKLQHKPVDLIYIPDGQHILQKPLDRIASQQGNVDWFRFWLQGYEDPDPSKAAQYARWEALRKL